MNEEVYAIVDLDGYVSQMREAAASSLSNDYKNDDLDSYITLKEMENIVYNECIGFDDENRPIMDEDSNENVFDKTVAWIHNIGLAKLASQDLIQCAWDDKLNEMVFWVEDKPKA